MLYEKLYCCREFTSRLRVPARILRGLLVHLTETVETLSWKALSPLAFLSLAGLNLFFSMSLFVRTLGLPSLVLLSPYLDWSAWIVSGSAFAWTCLFMSKKEARWIVRLGVLVLAGSVLEVLPSVFPNYSMLMAGSWLGGVLMSCAVAASAMISIVNPRVLSVSRAVAARLLLTFFFALVIPLQVWSIGTALPFPKPLRDYPRFDFFLGFEKLLQLMLPITVIVLVLLVTQWLWFPLVTKVITTRWRCTLGGGRASSVDEGRNFSANWVFLTGFSVLVGAFVSSFQWFRGYPLGQDARYYSLVLHRMSAVGVRIALSTERPLFFLALYAIQEIFGLETSLLLRLLPVALATTLAVATYFFTRFVVRNEKVAVLAAAFTAVSPHTTVGVEIFIVANWLGILLMMVFLYGFLRSVTQRSVLWAFLTVTLSGLVLGVHYFTWSFMILVILAFFLLSLVERRFTLRRDIAFCATVISGCIIVLIPAVLIAYWVGGGLLASLQLVEHMVGTFLMQATPMNFIVFLLNEERIYNYFGREHYAIPLLYMLALIGSVRLGCLRNDQGRLLRSWFIASSLGLLVVYYNEWWRFLYVVPLEMLAALGLAAFLGCVSLQQRSGTTTVTRDSLLPTALLLLVFFTLGLLLAFSSLPTFLILSGLVFVIIVELQWQLRGGREQIVSLLVVSLILEQLGRALYVLA